MNRKISNDASKEIIEDTVNELVFRIADDLKIDLYEAGGIVRATKFYEVLTRECALRNDHTLDSLLLILRKELIRARKYPAMPNHDQGIDNFYDFVKTMRHEIIYNISLGLKLNLDLIHVTLLTENIEIFTVSKNDAELVHEISSLFQRGLHYLEPISSENLKEIWLLLNSNMQTVLAHCIKK